MKTVVTHNGKFHSDDVFAVAMLQLFFGLDSISVTRTRDENEIENSDIVVDVGHEYDPERERFDHHQPGGAGTRSNGVPYAAAGLVWKKYGVQISGGETIAENIDAKIIQSIDGIDNGIDMWKPAYENVMPYTIGDYIDLYMPSREEVEPTKLTDAFLRACTMARDILTRLRERFNEQEQGYALAKQAYEQAEDKRIIVLDSSHSWAEELMKYPEPLYVVYPRLEGGRWGVQAVRVRSGSFELRAPFPAEWRGKTDAELQKATEVNDASFVHRDGFIGGAETKEGAIALAKKALKINT